MFCESYRQSLSDAAARGEELPRGLAEHLAGCEKCAENFAEARAMFALVDQSVRATVNADVPATLVHRVREGISARKAREATPWRKMALVASIASAVIAMVALVGNTIVMDKSGHVPPLNLPNQGSAASQPVPVALAKTAENLSSKTIGGEPPVMPEVTRFVGTRHSKSKPDSERRVELAVSNGSEPEVIVLPEESANLGLYMRRFSERTAGNRAAQMRLTDMTEMTALSVAKMEIEDVRIRNMDAVSDD